MTLTIIFAALFLIGVGLYICDAGQCYKLCGWGLVVGTCLVTAFGFAFLINMLIWIPSNKNSQILFEQLLAEKQTIESMLETDKDIDRFLLNSSVIEYNNKVIEQRANCDRAIYQDYYNQDLDWAGLQLIEWK